MILMSALLLQAAPIEMPLTKEERKESAKIVKKMKRWQGTAYFRGDDAVCKTMKTSGNDAIDQAACEATARCIAILNEKAAQLRQGNPVPVDTPIRQTDASKTVLECIAEEQKIGAVALIRQNQSESK